MPTMTKGERSVVEIIQTFSISDLPAPVAAEVEAATARIKDRMARTITDIIETGRDLQEVKSKLEHGQFESWLNTVFKMTDRTARRYMQAATWAEGKTDTVSDLTPKAIYLLSAPTTPKAAQKEVLEHLEAGKPITHHEVCEVVDKAKEQVRLEKITPEQKKKDEEKEKRRKAREKKREAERDRENRESAEYRKRREAAAKVKVTEVAELLVNKLSEDEVDKVYRVLGDFNVTHTMLQDAIIEAGGGGRG